MHATLPVHRTATVDRHLWSDRRCSFEDALEAESLERPERGYDRKLAGAKIDLVGEMP
jgi:hypothetical protein